VSRPSRQARKRRKALKRPLRRIRHRLVYTLTIALRRAMVFLPLSWARRLGGWLGAAAFVLMRWERRKALESIELAFGDTLTRSERAALGSRVFRNAGMGAAEGAFTSTGKLDPVLQGVRVKGLEHAQAAAKAGQGTVAVTAHFGNWEIGAPFLARDLPCKVGVVARRLSNPLLEEMLNDSRRKVGIHVFPTGETGRGYIRFLREGNLLCVLGDIDTSHGDGMFVDFFGRPAWTQTGIARLAQMGRAKILTGFISRDPRDPGHHMLRLNPPLPGPGEGAKSDWIAETTRAFTAQIEESVRARPEQWMWMHRRWRHRPASDGTPSMRPRPPRSRAH
jgi:KDO2-lipid IV(A) lauroyltransferase